MSAKLVSQNRRLLSGKQLAERLGFHPGTVRRLRREGRITGIVLNSRTVRYEESEVDRLVKEGRVVSAGGAR